MARQSLALILVASLLCACDSSKTETEQTATGTDTQTTTETKTEASAAPVADADAIPADWKKVESRDQGIAFAHPGTLKVHTDELKAGVKEPLYIAADDQMVIAVMPMPNTPEVTSKAAAEGILKALVREFKLTDVEQDAPVESKDVDGFASWTDIVASGNYEGKPHTIRSSGGKGTDKAKSSLGFFALYPEGEKNDEVYSKIHSSVVTLE